MDINDRENVSEVVKQYTSLVGTEIALPGNPRCLRIKIGFQHVTAVQAIVNIGFGEAAIQGKGMTFNGYDMNHVDLDRRDWGNLLDRDIYVTVTPPVGVGIIAIYQK